MGFGQDQMEFYKTTQTFLKILRNFLDGLNHQDTKKAPSRFPLLGALVVQKEANSDRAYDIEKIAK